MKFLDLFAGIGGFRLGLEDAGHECVGYVEKDKFARRSYEAIHDTKGEWTAHDITKVTNAEWRELRGTVDIITGGFPCQSFSIAGKRRGFEDTRGTLFFDIARAAEQIQPRYLFLENVRGLLSHDKGQTFATILTTLHEIGYDAEWCICNSKNYGVAQNRERVFIIGHLRGAGARKVFPLTEAFRKIDNSRVVADTLTTRYQNAQREGTYIETSGEKGGVMPVLTPDRLNKSQNGRRIKEPGEDMFTLTAQDRHGVIVAGNLDIKGKDQIKRVHDPRGLSPTLTTMQGGGQEPKIKLSYDSRIRKLTPRECWRLQGFPDWAFDKAQAVNSDSQLYKQAGNSVTVPVIAAIGRNLKEEWA